MPNYAWLYRLGIRPWERYERAVTARLDALLAEEEAARGTSRALDLGCGRGRYTRWLAGRGWTAVGVDAVPAAIEDARRHGTGRARYLVADVTALPPELGTFDLFLDIGCIQGFDPDQRRAAAAGVTALANPGATLLLLAFGPTRLRSLIGGVSPTEVVAAFPDWAPLAVEPADTAGLGWPMNRTAPRWYRLRRR